MDNWDNRVRCTKCLKLYDPDTELPDCPHVPELVPVQTSQPDKPDVAHNLIILGKMIEALPLPYRQPIQDQYEVLRTNVLQLMADIMARDAVVLELVQDEQVRSKYIEFDLEATRRERDRLRRQTGEDNA